MNYIFKKAFNLIKLYSRSIKFTKEEQLIKVIKKDVDSVYQQNSFISFFLKNTHNTIMDNYIGKTLTIDISSIEKSPSPRLEKINIVEKGKEIIR